MFLFEQINKFTQSKLLISRNSGNAIPVLTDLPSGFMMIYRNLQGGVKFPTGGKARERRQRFSGQKECPAVLPKHDPV